MFIYHEKSECITVSPKLTIHALSVRLRDLDRILGYLPMVGDHVPLETCLAQRLPNRYFLRYGDIADLCIGWNATLTDSQLLKVKPYPRAATGPDLRQFLIGSGSPLDFKSCTLKVFFPPQEERFVLVAFDETPAVDAFVHWMLDQFIRPFGVWTGPAERLPAKAIASLPSHTALVLIGLCGELGMVEKEEKALNAYLTLRKGRITSVSGALDKSLLGRILHGTHAPQSEETMIALSYSFSTSRDRASKSWLDEAWKKIYKRYESKK